jgi:hypothetical protein
MPKYVRVYLGGVRYDESMGKAKVVLWIQILGIPTKIISE